MIGKPDPTRRVCGRCGKPTSWRRCDVLNGLCYVCATGRPRLLTPETLAEYAQTSRPPLSVSRTVFGGTRRQPNA